MPTNNKLLLSAIGIASVAAVYFFAPEEKIESINTIFRAVTKPTVNACIKEWKDDLVNPDSIIYVESYEDDGWKGRRLNVKYKATNAYGAYVTNWMHCGLDSKGGIDWSETYNYRKEPYYYAIGSVPEAAAPAPVPEAAAPEL